MNTESFSTAFLGHIDGVGGRAVMVQKADVDTSSTSRQDTGLRVPQGSQIVGIRAIIGATAYSQAANLSVGHRLSDNAFAGNLALGTTANSVATFGDTQFSGKAAALENVGGDTTIFTKLSRAQSSADVQIEVSYILPVVEEDDAGSKPADVSDGDFPEE